MWLINTETLQLEHFANHHKNRYAILSHTWEENEVTFRTWVTRKGIQRKGCRKIMQFVQKAAERGFKYAWADTCCINKESSAELSEAINSMFKYYQDSAECYVYLSDLEPLVQSEEGWSIHNSADDTTFVRSKWFSRGWTLQELIAPRTVYFFDSAWQLYGVKGNHKDRIKRATGIPESILDGSQRIQDCSIACRMSWAANRQTTRIEDMAYCLLGIFGIHMPLLYGEGQEAFIRLQEEICRKTTDMSLFAWKTIRPDELYSGLLARSPSHFQDSAKVTRFTSAIQTDFGDEIAVTNRGIRFDNMSLYVSARYGVVLDLNCWVEMDEGVDAYIFICLSRAPESWVRCRADEIVYLDDYARVNLKSFEISRMFIRRTIEPGSLRSSDLLSRSILFEFSPGIILISAEPSHLWDLCMQGFVPNQHLHGAVHISTKLEERKVEEFLILCGMSNHDDAGKKILDWRQRYRFTTLGQGHAAFKKIRDLVQKKKLHTKEGYDEITDYLRTNYTPRGCWNEKDSRYHEDIAIGIRHRISVKVQVVSERGADWDSWDMVKFHVLLT